MITFTPKEKENDSPAELAFYRANSSMCENLNKMGTTCQNEDHKCVLTVIQIDLNDDPKYKIIESCCEDAELYLRHIIEDRLERNQI